MARRAHYPSSLLFLVLGWACPALAGVRYDQTQTGDYNVHLDLKNIEIIAYVDGGALGINDYEYDYNDYTLKPPSNGSVAPSGGFGGSPTTNITTPGNASTLGAPNPGNASAPAGSSLNSTEALQSSNGTSNSNSGAEQAETSTKQARRCGAGFYRDPAGRCRRLRRPIKLTGLLQKATNRISGK